MLSPNGTTLAVSASTGVYHGTATVVAQLTSGGTLVAGEPVDIRVGGTDLGQVTTDTNGQAVISGASLAGLQAGSYIGFLIARFAGDSNFAASSGSNDLTITPAPLNVVADNLTKVYGQANPTLTGTATGVLNGDDVSATFTTTAAAFSDIAPGGYAIAFGGLTGVKAEDYSTTVEGGSFSSGTLTVTPASLTVAASDASKVYGEANPTLTGTVLGVLNGDSVTPLFSTNAAPFSDVIPGGYAVTEAGLSGPKALDYTVTSSIPGTLTVTPAPLTIVADDASKVYGQANPALTGTVSGVLNGDDVTASYATTASAYSDVVAAGYAITPSGLTGGKAGDYSVAVAGSSVVPATLTVTPAPISIAAAGASKVYGQANPALTGTISGLLGGDTVDPTYTTSATAASDVTPAGYAIGLAGITGRKSGDYAVTTFNPATLAVTPAPLTISADAQSKVYGQADPSFTASYSGFVLGQGPSSLAGTLGFTSPATAASHVGAYPITPSGLSSTDYAITDADGSLAVTPAPLAITAVDVLKDYGQAVPTLTAIYSGFVNGDTAASLASPLSLATPATAATHFGVYPITAGGAASGDYAIRFTDGAIAVTPAILTVMPVDVILDSGATVPTLTADYSGFVNGDTAASLSTPVTLSTSATSASPVGVYPIAASGGASADYAIVAVPGAIAITPAPIVTGPAAFVTSLYETILGRTPDAGGLDYWLAQLSGGQTDQAVARRIYASKEAVAYRSAHPKNIIGEPTALNLALKAQAQA